MKDLMRKMSGSLVSFDYKEHSFKKSCDIMMNLKCIVAPIDFLLNQNIIPNGILVVSNTFNKKFEMILFNRIDIDTIKIYNLADKLLYKLEYDIIEKTAEGL